MPDEIHQSQELLPEMVSLSMLNMDKAGAPTTGSQPAQSGLNITFRASAAM